MCGLLPSSHEILSIFQFGEWLVLVSVLTQEAFVTHEKRYFEELVFKEEVEPKHFLSVKLTISSQFLVLQR